ncbi:hypothetical protein [Chitinophaga sp.]|uniref:hypothetical protein n=1 Tax=Chitinophaga sp. TaxID=1869181 RepID=UPI0031DAF249
MDLLIRFTDQSPNYTYGVEFGRILAKMECGIPVISNAGFPVREENRQVLIDACTAYGYIPAFQECQCDGWLEFTATKSEVAN